MKKKNYISPSTVTICFDHEPVMIAGFDSTKVDGSLPDGTKINYGGNGEEEDDQLGKECGFWDSDSWATKYDMWENE